jgi:hypothetical protein
VPRHRELAGGVQRTSIKPPEARDTMRAPLGVLRPASPALAARAVPVDDPARRPKITELAGYLGYWQDGRAGVP